MTSGPIAKILEGVARLTSGLGRATRHIAHNEYESRAGRLSTGTHGLVDTDHTHGISGRGFERNRSRYNLTPPLDPARAVGQRRYSKDEFITMWEAKIGRKMTSDELETLDKGCVGVTMLHLGLTGRRHPSTALAFADPVSHRAVARVEEILAPGDIVNKDVNNRQKWLRDSEKKLEHERNQPGATEDSPEVQKALVAVETDRKELEYARLNAADVMADMSKEYEKEMKEIRRESKVEGDKRTFERVSTYAEKIDDILAQKPKDASEFMRMIRADKDLAPLYDIVYELPPGKPSDWETAIYAKHFWSGQEMVTDSSGKLVVSGDNIIQTGATHYPQPNNFTPDEVTGRVDMRLDFSQAKPGFINYDYGFYDTTNGNWWHANHNEANDPDDPMRILQSTSEKFFSGYSDFDSSVICLGLVNKSR
ncbi:hypothetical protein ACFQZZ_00955 [Nocardia sp. GCM10030253]|uniref:hypothetical protein n=1 Tax=Nocardia sp. GCM10030253 TaxID=3273404 RepID=UPI00364150F0